MNELNFIDYLFLYSLVSIWVVLLFNIFLTLSGYKFYTSVTNHIPNVLEMEEFPFVSIMVPAHNEEKVIGRTVKSLLTLNYPDDKMELIVINDNSSDNTGEILEVIRREFPHKNFKVITTTKENGGKGKSNALNIGFKSAVGEFIAVYDADNTPEKLALRYLINRIINDHSLGAVIGKFRTRNKEKNLLTRFINIETLSFQWMAQAGRWQLFKLTTIPGTNFMIRRSILEEIGGWDINAIAEDTEISFQIYKLGYKIAFMPLAVTWEQEPETLRVWFKQRTRWAKGNVYVLLKYIKKIFKGTPASVIFDVSYFFSIYFLFLSSVIISDVIFILGIFTKVKVNIPGNFFLLWMLAYLLFILEVSIALTMEKGESSIKNIGIVALMYFTYCQMWMLVAIKGIILYIKDKVLKKEAKWYKTERF